MGCEQYRELISALLDGELEASEQAALEQHLRSCADCAAVYQGFMALSGALADDLAEPPESLRANVMAELRREQIYRANRRSRPLRGMLATAACVALLLGAALFSGVLNRGTAVDGDQGGLKLAGASFPVSRGTSYAAEEAGESAAAKAAPANGELFLLEDSAAESDAAETNGAMPRAASEGVSLQAMLEFLDGEIAESGTPAEEFGSVTVYDGEKPCELSFYLQDGALLCRLPDGTLLRSNRSPAELEAFLNG